MTDDIHVRMIIRYSDYKQFRSTSRIIFDGEDITDKGGQPNQPAPAQPNK